MEHSAFASQYLRLIRLIRIWRTLAPTGYRPDCIYALARHLNPYQMLAQNIASTLCGEFPELPSRALWHDTQWRSSTGCTISR